MNQVRNDINDAVIELVFCSFPGLTEQEFRVFVHKVLRIVDYAATEVLKEERHVCYLKNHYRSRN